MSNAVKPALQTKTAPNQIAAIKGHVYTMAAAFAGVVFGVLGSMGFVGNYLDSQFAAQTAALDKRLVSVAPASASTDACFGTSTAAVGGGNGSGSHAKASTAPKVAHAVLPEVGGRGGDGAPVGGNHMQVPLVHQLISGSISNTGPNSTATINATNNFDYKVTNNNNVSVSNTNHQSSSTGSASTSFNTNAGSSSTGSSTNTNTTYTSVGIEN